jgi:hypothetical protein
MVQRLARRISDRSHSSPRSSILAHRSGGKRMDRCTSVSAGSLRGRPPLFFGFSMRQVYVMQILVDKPAVCVIQ